MEGDSAELERQFSQEAARQEAKRFWETSWKVNRRDGTTIIPPHANDLFRLQALHASAKHVAKSTGAVCKEVPGVDGKPVLVLTKVGRSIAKSCNAIHREFVERHSRHAFNPWIKLMVVAVRHWHPGYQFDLLASRICVSTEDQKRLGRIARFVRRVSESHAFKRRLQDERRLALQNFRSACLYMTSLFARYSRLLILRVDLYYTQEGRDEAWTEEARAAFERFVRMLRCGRIVPDVLGYLTSREVGAERGMHFHVLVVMDGHKYRDADGYTRMIGERWVNDYTGVERGTYYNCYARRHEYEFNGLGLVHMSDWRKLIGLRQAMLYMTKAEYLIKPKGHGEKNFRRGLVKHVGVKLGAPRQPGHEMSTVLRILGASGSFDRSR
jgi:hypothetical protein